MKYEGDTSEIELLKKAVREVLSNTSALEVSNAPSYFPLRVVKQVAKIFFVSSSTVKNWHRKGLLRGNYQIISGRSCRLVFSNTEVERFFTENFPSREDLEDHPCSPRKGSKAARLIEKMFKMNALYSRTRQRVEDDQEG